jgi:PAS domain S-box-containing protein
MARMTSEIALRTVLDRLPDAVVVVDRTGCIVYVNERATQMTGWSAAELLGASVEMIIPERLRAAHRAGFRRFLAGGPHRLIGVPTTLPVLRADGTEHEADLILSPGGDGDADQLVVGALRDVGSRVALERELEASRFLAASVAVTDRLHRASSIEDALRGVLPAMCAHLDWDLATLWLVESDGEAMRCVDVWSRPDGPAAAVMEQASRLRRFRRGEGLPGRVLEAREPIVVANLSRAATLPRVRSAAASGFSTAVALPLVSGPAVLGVVELFSRIPTVVTDELLTMMQAAGRQIGQFVDRLRGEEQLRELAETLQASLLPPEVPQIPGMELETLYRSGVTGLAVGGDTYDVFPVGAGRWAVLIGDVCGKGAAAASTTAVARYAARAAAIDHPGDPARVLATVNEALVRDSSERPFLTAAFAVVTPNSDGAHLRLAVAGHPLPLLVSAARAVREIGVPGQLLGILERVDVATVDVTLAAGETAVFFTDGVIEARTASGEQFGDARLRDVVAGFADRPLARLVREIATAATRFAAGAPQDDMAIVGLRAGRGD